MKPHVVIVGTGGTIAGRRAAARGGEYASAVTGVDELVAAVPGLADLARLSAEQLYQLDSVELGLGQMLALARRIDALLARGDVDAVVVTHGTDTLEESAFLANLVVRSAKPVVFLGSMRPADALSADGPDNLFDAVAVAAAPESRGRGVLVVFDDQVHAARDVTKITTTRTDAFRSPYGALGEVVAGRPRFVRAVTRAHTTTSAFDVRSLPDALPRVEIVVTHPELPLAVLDTLAAAGARGLVHVGPGNGNVAAPVLAKLDELRDRGLVVVRSTRVANGMVIRNGAGSDDDHGFVAADDHNPAQARILLALALTQTADPAEIQRLFWTH